MHTSAGQGQPFLGAPVSAAEEPPKRDGAWLEAKPDSPAVSEAPAHECLLCQSCQHAMATWPPTHTSRAGHSQLPAHGSAGAADTRVQWTLQRAGTGQRPAGRGWSGSRAALRTGQGCRGQTAARERLKLTH